MTHTNLKCSFLRGKGKWNKKNTAAALFFISLFFPCLLIFTTCFLCSLSSHPLSADPGVGVRECWLMGNKKRVRVKEKGHLEAENWSFSQLATSLEPKILAEWLFVGAHGQHHTTSNTIQTLNIKKWTLLVVCAYVIENKRCFYVKLSRTMSDDRGSSYTKAMIMTGVCPQERHRVETATLAPPVATLTPNSNFKRFFAIPADN